MPVEIGPPEVSKSKGNKPLKASVSDDYQPSTQESKLDPFADEAAVANEFRGYGESDYLPKPRLPAQITGLNYRVIYYLCTNCMVFHNNNNSI